ncbi:DHHC zinc finger protein (macronuclear) [Tetrahymena thermophila SB210]|uniref:DHHC zinc finger protein n=1 Tax=Tetrahymena thermophila (strain SB210) TaxID=312017 RepID=W7XH73_TETTS|nr:DHHC zinc finger protein [Tetrahymena thermophila SB210]EWS73681.1 DHHC zinc finger protein [Tetrahymena thermophila SB210]|eukprot:XP_012653811.1 DHHC zinc finger protein [Tetrahymena thermophila SB210]
MDNKKLMKVPTKVDSELGNFLVYNENAQGIKFKTLFEDKRTIIVFIRHFFCYVCQDFVRALAQDINFGDLKQKNINLYVVGCGEISGIKNFSLETKFPSQLIYVDTQRFTYNKLGMMRAETISQVRSGKKSEDTKTSTFCGLCKTACSIITKKRQGDIYQLGGTYIFETDGKIIYTFVDDSSNGHCSSKEILDLIQKYSQNIEN